MCYVYAVCLVCILCMNVRVVYDVCGVICCVSVWVFIIYVVCVYCVCDLSILCVGYVCVCA